MPISQALLPEFDHEMRTTRKVLERVPEDRPDWRPHPKSMTLGRLAGHVAELPSFAVSAITLDQLDFAPPDGERRQPLAMTTSAALIEKFDRHAVAAREAIAGVSDEALHKTWTLLSGGQVLFAMPRLAVLRSMVMNHIIHHRAQLGVYLRLNDIAVPASYGPSADETAGF